MFKNKLLQQMNVENPELLYFLSEKRKKKKKVKLDISEYLLGFHSFIFSPFFSPFIHSLPYRKAEHELLCNIAQQLKYCIIFHNFKELLNTAYPFSV